MRLRDPIVVVLVTLLITVAVPSGAMGHSGTGVGGHHQPPVPSPDVGGHSGPTVPSTGAPATVAPSADSSNATMDPRIVELYPNPTTDENRGEYLVVRLPDAGNWSLSDGYHEAPIPGNATGTVALSMAPDRTAEHIDRAAEHVDRSDDVAIRALNAHFPLSADGDRIELRHDGDVVDVVAYDRVREGYRWRAEWGEWRPDGYEPLDPRRADDVTATPFVLPDSPGPPVEPLRGADDRILLAGYTIESDRVVDALVNAAERGVTVRVLVEGTPVGGFPEPGARAADRLVDAGVEVRVFDGDPDRFRFHHAKYAVADDEAVVLTENWKASGTGGRSSRGWGVTVVDGRVADDLATLFCTDRLAADTRPWSAFRADATFHGGGRANGTYPERFETPAPGTADVELLTAPGNAEDRIVARIDAADDRVLAVVPRTGGTDARIVAALRRAADRGVDVHLLLSGAWYDREENRALAEALAEEPIAVDIAEPRGRFEKVHAKGLVIDETVVVGSLNWNEVAATENREVLLAIESAEIAGFFARAYAADWRGGSVRLPFGLLGGLGASLAVAVHVARAEVSFVAGDR